MSTALAGSLEVSKTENVSSSPPKRSSLIGLPREIRDMILKLLLPFSAVIQPALAFWKKSLFADTKAIEDQVGLKRQRNPLQNPKESYPAVLAASRQLYAEGKDILYNKTFEIIISPGLISSIVMTKAWQSLLQLASGLDEKGNAVAVTYEELQKFKYRNWLDGKLASYDYAFWKATLSPDYFPYHHAVKLRITMWAINTPGGQSPERLIQVRNNPVDFCDWFLQWGRHGLGDVEVKFSHGAEPTGQSLDYDFYGNGYVWEFSKPISTTDKGIDIALLLQPFMHVRGARSAKVSFPEDQQPCAEVLTETRACCSAMTSHEERDAETFESMVALTRHWWENNRAS